MNDRNDAADFDPYEELARFYDLDVAGFDEDIALYEAMARRVASSVLELGCGSGRIALALARAGFEVTGVDRSAAMLALARARLAAEPELAVRLIRSDMRCLALRGRFGLVIIGLDAFLHLADQQAQLDCLVGARACLHRGGRLVLDLAGPASAGWEDWSPGLRPLVLAWSRPFAGNARLSKFSAFAADAARQTHEVSEIYERSESDGSVRRWTVEYSLRYAFPFELDLLMRAVGLQVQARYGDYELAPFRADSPRQIVVAEPRPRRAP